MRGIAVDRAEQMPLARNEIEKTIGEALDEQSEIVGMIEVRTRDRLEGDGIELVAFHDWVDPRAQREGAIGIEEADDVRSREARVGAVGVDWREKLRENRHGENKGHQNEAGHSR